LSNLSAVYRPMVAHDFEACADVLDAADDELHAQRGLPPLPRNRVALIRLFEHILQQHPERAWVAERGAAVVGFGSAVAYADLTFLSFLFVLPELQAAGIGRALLERAMQDDAYRGVCIDSIQPISAALYGRYGMTPRVPLYMLTGAPRRELPALPAGVELRPIDAATAAALDRELCGVERPADHEGWLRWGRRRYGIYESGAALGYGYVQESGRLGPLVVKQEELLLPLLGALMNQVEPVESWMVTVPGPAAQAFQGLLNAGFQLEGPPGIFCATELRVDHRRYLPASFALP
jgi:GNAT superfamily N-acetyltransferase